VTGGENVNTMPKNIKQEYNEKINRP